MKLADCPLNPEFKGNAKNIVEIAQKSMTSLIIAHESNFRGVDQFSIREIYLDSNDNWAPGKGITVQLNKKQELLRALGAYCATVVNTPG